MYRSFSRPASSAVNTCSVSSSVLPEVKRPGLHPRRLQRPNLIAHQRDQGRDDHSHPVTAQCRQLEAQAICRPPVGMIASVFRPGQHSLDNFFLSGPEIRKAKDRSAKVLVGSAAMGGPSLQRIDGKRCSKG